MRALFVLPVAVALLVSLGCDGDPSPTDAGLDAAMDAGRDAARPDAAPLVCTPECESGDTCCPSEDGPTCYALRSDPRHCGSCNVDCVASNRGDRCEASQCVCGDSPLGCQGTTGSFCCPPRTPGGVAYCANLAKSAADCGACGNGCDPTQADHCDGGRCICGDERGACDGTPESLCCADSLVDISCVDTTTDRFHCGACNVLCQGVERCENGTCTRGGGCEAGCPLGQICCDGTCCERTACFAGTCGAAPDGGLPDGGLPDGGLPDGGLPDGGLPDGGADAGVPDGGASDAGPADGGPADGG
jgi:hypothetical protein